MSFSKTVKEEIIKKNIFKKETLALVQGIVLSSGSLIISGGKLSFVVSNENEAVIELLKQKLTELFEGIEIDVVKVVKNFKNKERFELSVFDEYNAMVLEKLRIATTNADGELEISDVCDKSFMKSNESMLSFLAGVFLGTGSVSVPQETEGAKRKYGHHFEIDVASKNQADIISEIMSNFDIFPKMVERNELYVIYLKNSDVICDLLGLFGASKVVLNLMNDRVSRDMNNMTNRQINCMTANIGKTVDAALKQIKAIEVIQNTIGIENLPEPLAEAALSRLSNPEGSLSDLLQTLEKKISKGALAQRFTKIIKLAEELGESNE